MTATGAEVASDIWSRAIKPGEGDLPPEAARFFLGIKLSGADLQRIETLSLKHRHGELTETEEKELGAYTEFGWFFDFMRSKARLSLRAAERQK